MWLCNCSILNFLIYEENLIFFIISVAEGEGWGEGPWFVSYGRDGGAARHCYIQLLVNRTSTIHIIITQIMHGMRDQYTRVPIRVQWFWLFFTFWGITTHPWHPKGPRIWKLAKKNFQLHAWPAEIFGKNRKMRLFGMISKFNVRSPVWQTLPFFWHVLFMGSLNHTYRILGL
jgi:hypothetical protein